MKTTLEIQNLKCGGCEATIYNKLSRLNNIQDLFINSVDATVTFNYNSIIDIAAVKEALFSIGYPVKGEDNKLMTKAKSYVSCAIGRITK